MFTWKYHAGLKFHFASIHENASKELIDHRSEISHYRFEVISPLMWTYCKTQVFLWWNLLNGLLLKKIGRCTTFLALRVKVTSCACLGRSGLKLIFRWKAHSFISSKSAQSCLAAVFFGSLIIVNKEASSPKGFRFD